jgi:hypothetical protein
VVHVFNNICVFWHCFSPWTLEPPWLYATSMTPVHLDVKLYRVINIILLSCWKQVRDDSMFDSQGYIWSSNFMCNSKF